MRTLMFALAAMCAAGAGAQTYAQLMVWDSHERHPQIRSIEFAEPAEELATYDAIYGHGAMMENESYGLRVYIDHRQSIDLYGKRRAEPELATTCFYSTAQHVAEGYGQDILYVGGSVGAGSFRGWQDGAPTTIQPVAARGQRVVCAGPDSAVIETWVRDWQYQGRTLQMTQRYTMRRGQRATQVDIWLDGDTDGLLFATGAQKLEDECRGLVDAERGIAASWGRNVPDKAQPLDAHSLGIAVVVPPQHLAGTVEDDLNYLCLLRPVGGHITYRLLVAPQMEPGGYHTADDWLGRGVIQ